MLLLCPYRPIVTQGLRDLLFHYLFYHNLVLMYFIFVVSHVKSARVRQELFIPRILREPKRLKLLLFEPTIHVFGVQILWSWRNQSKPRNRKIQRSWPKEAHFIYYFFLLCFVIFGLVIWCVKSLELDYSTRTYTMINGSKTKSRWVQISVQAGRTRV